MIFNWKNKINLRAKYEAEARAPAEALHPPVIWLYIAGLRYSTVQQIHNYEANAQYDR